VSFDVPLMTLIAAAELAALAGIVWAIVRATGDYRSHPYPRTVWSTA
jgi:hypothetical protein